MEAHIIKNILEAKKMEAQGGNFYYQFGLLSKECDRLRAELEAVKNEWNADKARLDWLSTIDGADWFLYCDCGGLTREAIDAAIAESKEVSGRDGTAEGLMW